MKGLTEEEFREKYQQWQKDFQAAIQKLNDAQQDEKTSKDEKAMQKLREEYTKVYEQKSKFMNEEMTGFVWLYRQK